VPPNRKPPANVSNRTRFAIAFPFSSLKIAESPDEVRDLAALVADLADAFAAVAPGDEAEALRQRAHALLDDLADAA
jgi:ElaB/YqjD/DUF883 family membrane-anchored ribosome-binding protein